jgi:excinuclease ABC subunit C
MLQQARDEAHRFAVTFQRQKRAARTITSELLKIPGVGPTKRRALLTAFGSVQGVREATIEQIAAVPGFGLGSAARLLSALGVPSRETPADIPTDPTPDVPPDSTLE